MQCCGCKKVPAAWLAPVCAHALCAPCFTASAVGGCPLCGVPARSALRQPLKLPANEDPGCRCGSGAPPTIYCERCEVPACDSCGHQSHGALKLGDAGPTLQETVDAPGGVAQRLAEAAVSARAVAAAASAWQRMVADHSEGTLTALRASTESCIRALRARLASLEARVTSAAAASQHAAERCARLGTVAATQMTHVGADLLTATTTPVDRARAVEAANLLMDVFKGMERQQGPAAAADESPTCFLPWLEAQVDEAPLREAVAAFGCLRSAYGNSPDPARCHFEECAGLSQLYFGPSLDAAKQVRNTLVLVLRDAHGRRVARVEPGDVEVQARASFPNSLDGAAVAEVFPSRVTPVHDSGVCLIELAVPAWCMSKCVANLHVRVRGTRVLESHRTQVLCALLGTGGGARGLSPLLRANPAAGAAVAHWFPDRRWAPVAEDVGEFPTLAADCLVLGWSRGSRAVVGVKVGEKAFVVPEPDRAMPVSAGKLALSLERRPCGWAAFCPPDSLLHAALGPSPDYWYDLHDVEVWRQQQT